MLLSLTATGAALAAGDPFAEHVRKTEPLTPEQEQKAFHLPPGFEIQLVAAEPDIGKPMNMAFDTRGRLWITQSREYPFPATNQPYRDQIKVISDFKANGRARKISTFASGLNIPIGLLPYRDGVIAFSIPNMYYFADTNHDGRADTKDLVLGRFGFEKDTHGMTSSFRRGFDGWIYADHGFNNDTTLTAKDGSTIKMNSGNTYRFRPDGSRVEQFTWGQVNPFGLMFDPLGDLWASDCHSSPIYLLLRNAYYPSFGKPHDGLGFAPNICAHSHGSTAIAGMVYYAATNFPPEFHNNTFVGNVTTCRINRDSYIEHGSTRIAREEPDFLRCDDPWFRPVDLQLGPDGALYVADFYNRIIAHYEVTLDHPGRDRERGRIWRIQYVGGGTNGSHRVAPAQIPDFARASTSKLIKQLANPNIAVRNLATSELADRVGQAAAGPVEKMVLNKKSPTDQKVHGLWLLHRLGALKSETLGAAVHDTDRTVRVHAMRILSESFRETGVFPAAERQWTLEGLKDKDAYVQRAAADALGQHTHGTEHGDFESIDGLVDLQRQIPANDPELLYVCRVALRNHLRVRGAFSHLTSLKLNERDSKVIADVAIGVPAEESASFLLQHVQRFTETRDHLSAFLRHVARYAPGAQLDNLAKFSREEFTDDPDFQFTLFKAAQDGVTQRGAKLTEGLREWAAALAEKLLSSDDETNAPWVSVPIKSAAVAGNPWTMERRKSADGKEATLLSSFTPGGESLTGILRSKPFTIPPKLTFFLAGHDGSPDKPRLKKNVIRLVSGSSNEVLSRAEPPRNDVAQKITWDLSAHAGEQGILEIVDRNGGRSFAWLAAGRFDPPIVPMPEHVPNQLSHRQQNAAELTRTVPLAQFESQMAKLFDDEENPPEVRAAAAQTLVALNQQTNLPLVANKLADVNQPAALRESLATVLAELNSPAAREATLGAISAAPQRLQIKLATALAGNAAGADALLTLAEQRKLPPQVLNDRAVKEKLTSAKPRQFDERFARLTKGLASAAEQLQKVIEERRTAFDSEQASAERGHAVFEKACIICHQLDGAGAVVGPQLDGVGNRGLERIIEDVLDPSRSIDPAFRPNNVTLKDETSMTGLLRREEGETLVFVDSQGKEIAVAKKEIAERRESQISLMPSNFAEALTKDEFNDLMAFLLAHGPKPESHPAGQ
jgi:putative heme-binding domain-containing protein